MSQSALDAALNQLMTSDTALAEMYVAKQRDLRREKELTQKLQAMQNAAMQNAAMQNAAQQGGMQNANWAGQGIANGYGQYAPFAAPAAPPPPNAQVYTNIQTQNGINAAIPLDEESERADAAQQEALKNMNPLARFKYEALFRVLEIKVRYVPMGRSSVAGSQWILAKFVRDKGVPVRQEWSAPSKDPGCSLKTWDAMMSELMDEVTRREGIDVTTDFDYRAESAGDETASSAGNP